MKRLSFLVLATCLLSLPARADGIPIVGNAEQSAQAGSNQFSIASSTTSFAVSSTWFLVDLGLGPCSSGSICDLTVTVPARVDGGVNVNQNFTWIDGTTGTHPFPGLPTPTTGFVTGQLVFPNPGFVFSFPPNTLFSFSGTIPFSGQLSGFLGDFNDPDGQVFSVDLSGTATFDIFGQESLDGTFARFTDSQFNFEGTATPVPEPSSLLLLGSGLAIFARRMRKAIKSN